MSNKIKDWTEPVNDVIYVPDELESIFNSIVTQLRFHTLSGKSEELTAAHILYNAQVFFNKGDGVSLIAHERFEQIEKP